MRRLYCTLLYCLFLLTNVAAQQPHYGKLSPRLRQLVRTHSSRHHATSKSQHSQSKPSSICAFIRISDDADEVLSNNGCRQLAKVGNIYIADIPLNSMGALSNDNRVKRIEANWGNRLQLDTVAFCVNADPIYVGQQLPQAYTGKGVLMGLMDVGFDLTHPTFYSRDMTQYRIQRLWDMLSKDTVGSKLYVGRDYTSEDELKALGCCRDGYIQTHGTHTAGIAAGSGYNTNYRGLAYESDICLVANAVTNDIELIDSADYYKYTFATDALGFKYIFDYADAIGKPCVISFSEGSSQDFWGYDQLYYEMLDSLIGPGHIIVSSAGNQGMVKSWFHKPKGQLSMGTFLSSTEQNVMSTLKSADDFTIRLVVYTNDRDTLSIPTRQVVEREDSCLVLRFPIDGGDHSLTVAVEGYPSCYIAEETCYDVKVSTLEGSVTKVPLSIEVVGEGADVEVYRGNGTFTTNNLNPALNAGEYTHNILSPASAPCVICVGNNSYRTGTTNYMGEWMPMDGNTEGFISKHSSVGPTFDGRIKPDVVAAGTNVISAFSSHYMETHNDRNTLIWCNSLFDYNGRTYGWQVESGTSMSSPAVAGIIAMWLQAKPDLTREQIMEVLKRTCRQIDTSLDYPNNIYGYGEIDAYAGLLDILRLSGINEISKQQTKAHISIENGTLLIRFTEHIDQPFRLRLFTMNGHCILDKTLPAHQSQYPVTLAHLPQAVYAIQLDGEKIVQGSTLIRI